MAKVEFSDVKNYLRRIAPSITEQEMREFHSLIATYDLLPQDVHVIKYSSSQPAQFVISKDALLKLADRSGKLVGFKAGIVVMEKDGKIVNREGAFYMPEKGEKLLGGWAEVEREGWKEPVRIKVRFDEYAKRINGKLAGSWRQMPATMIRKVALAQAIKEAFPLEVGSVADETDGVHE